MTAMTAMDWCEVSVSALPSSDTCNLSCKMHQKPHLSKLQLSAVSKWPPNTQPTAALKTRDFTYLAWKESLINNVWINLTLPTGTRGGMDEGVIVPLQTVDGRVPNWQRQSAVKQKRPFHAKKTTTKNIASVALYSPSLTKLPLLQHRHQLFMSWIKKIFFFKKSVLAAWRHWLFLWK